MQGRLFLYIYLGGLVAISIVRGRYALARDRSEPVARVHGVLDSIFMAAAGTGLGTFPLIVTFTGWLDFADYRLPQWAGWLGVLVFLAALVLLWRSHADLGVNWSPKVEAKEGQKLVTRGVYRWVRHPMYAAHWVWALAQPLLVWNWVAGPAMLLGFAPFYFLRASREERFMLKQFGDEYATYKERTGALWPRLRR